MTADSSTGLAVQPTADGSPTLYVPALDEHYHSVHGARQESAHVFIRHGLLPRLTPGAHPRILEVGLGTGLNALLTRAAIAAVPGAAATYDALETVPLPAAIIAALAPGFAPEEEPVFRQLHAAPWETAVPLGPGLTLTKHLARLETAQLPAAAYDLIYFDAFAPQKQPELWTAAVFRQLRAATAPGGVLVTYCAQGQFRRDLRTAGWQVEKLPGPPGKREMTRATTAP